MIVVAALATGTGVFSQSRTHFSGLINDYSPSKVNPTGPIGDARGVTPGRERNVRHCRLFGGPGHNGGQVALELMRSSLAPARLITSYIRGWFQKGDAQLYVNRGTGTITFPIRIGARPEITVLELART